MSLASLDPAAQIALGFMVSILAITGGLFVFILTRKNNPKA